MLPVLKCYSGVSGECNEFRKKMDDSIVLIQRCYCLHALTKLII
jgi:hypothetical protein